ncbi:MAG: hypothetical protein A3I73_00865 [Omnitrophica bacterium RIFCSPLOWO2_02_FULL_45_16]|nr:MAG: hypothetical protein A3C51_04295 [Omnitrophica bacterium RIFCSPHIGHO2_02_FULL_46_20]OGX00756.1 MAG: hypothetical protein A3I73_00865 [Omnitrophica bacterium RIFCSPLOWO2_02_FULL_45_16]
MKIICIVIVLLCCSIAYANDWDVLQYDLDKMITGKSDGPAPQSSMSERYDPSSTVYVMTDNTPSMPDSMDNPYEDD